MNVILLQTLLSVLALWTFLTLLVVGLLLIHKVLNSIAEMLEKIVWGVRAIEQETTPLERLASDLPGMTRELTASLHGMAAGASALTRPGGRHA